MALPFVYKSLKILKSFEAGGTLMRTSRCHMAVTVAPFVWLDRNKPEKIRADSKSAHVATTHP
jgi:hypothetical protein